MFMMESTLVNFDPEFRGMNSRYSSGRIFSCVHGRVAFCLIEICGWMWLSSMHFKYSNPNCNLLKFVSHLTGSGLWFATELGAEDRRLRRLRRWRIDVRRRRLPVAVRTPFDPVQRLLRIRSVVFHYRISTCRKFITLSAANWVEWNSNSIWLTDFQIVNSRLNFKWKLCSMSTCTFVRGVSRDLMSTNANQIGKVKIP